MSDLPPIPRSATTVEALLAALDRPGAVALDLLERYQHGDYASLWQGDPRLYRAFAMALIRAGHPTRAYELAREGLSLYQDDPQLRYDAALALARGGNLARATVAVKALLDDPALEKGLQVEALSLAGRLDKDRYARAVEGAEHQATRDESTRAAHEANAATSPTAIALAHTSAEWYERAYQLSGAIFPGINAATMHLLAGESGRAGHLAREVISRGEASPTSPAQAGDYWLYATLGEAHLLTGDDAGAERWYRRAVAAAGERIGDIASMRRNIRLIERVQPVGAWAAGVFNLGSVVVFSGHMVDHPQRAAGGRVPRFPEDAALERRVAEAIGAELEVLQARVGYSSAACGGDLLFAEQILARGAELHVVLPFDREDFLYTSVDFGIPGFRHWRERFERVLQRATMVHYATREHFLGDDVLFGFAADVQQGLALIRAAELGVEAQALLLQDPTDAGAAAPLPGGTASFRERLHSQGRAARVIDLAALRTATTPRRAPATSPAADVATAPATVLPAGDVRRQVKVMLFSDVKNYSHLSEEQTPSFFGTFLDEVAQVIHESEHQPAFLNTWGDGLFLVFDAVVDGAAFALHLLQRIEEVDWQQVGLPGDTTVRIGMHAGPVYPRWDAIIERMNYFGSHVNRAARTEPVTTPGCAFTSEQFAALLAMEPNHPYLCEYVGVELLAKEYDRCALYRLTSRLGSTS